METGFRIVGIGASAGGLKAVSELLHCLPGDLNMAFAVVMHLDPTHPSGLAELLGRVCEMPVRQAEDGIELMPGHVYVIPPNNSMSVRGPGLHLTPREASHHPQRPIDLFLRSLAEEHDDRGIGIILSGTGSDGTAGLQAIKAVGGITFAQDDSADHSDMPSSAVAADCVDAVLPPEGIAQELTRISRHPSEWLYREPAVETACIDQTEEALNGLVKKLSRVAGIEFINYKQATIRRRIQRRILLLGLERVEQYASYFDEHQEEAETLCQDILIRVTGFFRDPEVFQALDDTVFPAMLKHRASGEPIRIWMPGCASGEEVYSLAIALLEFLGERAATFPIKLFGTDVSEQAIAQARSGRYRERITAEVSPERLRRFFVREEAGYVITKAVRDLCVFARQDATRDPPFSNLDLISCRNLLIYLGPNLQKRVVPIFHYALRDGGHLLLGTAESVGTMDNLFATVDARHSIYLRKSVPRRLHVDLGRHETGVADRIAVGSVEHTVGGFDVLREADRIVLAKYAPAGVLVDEELEVLQFRGDTGAFLAPAPGPPSNNLLRMAREGLLPDLRAIVKEGKERGVPVRREGLRIKADGQEVHASLELTPIRIPGSAERCFAILFEEVSAQHDVRPPPVVSHAPKTEFKRVERLERDLVATRDYLRANVERLEISNEELRAANEEILSSNEELHSTNEELQTTKEELQAANEELLTTNEELRHRNREVALLSDDLTNLLDSVKIPIVMLGRDLRIRRFTPSAAKTFGISGSDLGRSFPDLESEVTVPGLEAMLLGVLDTLAVTEQEVQNKEGRWYAVCVRPYRTQDDKVDGLVIALSDIDMLKRLANKLKQARDFAEAIVMSVREPLLVLDGELSIRMSNRSFEDTFSTASDAVRNQRLGHGVTWNWVTPKLLELLDQVGKGGDGFTDLDVEGEIPGRGVRHLRMDARAVPGDGERDRLVLLALEDITDSERKREEEERLARKILETQRLESLGVLAGGIAHDFNNILTAILGFAELIQKKLPADSPALSDAEKIVQSALRAADLCSGMLAYSGRGRFQITAIDLSGLIAQSRSLLEAMVSKRAAIQFNLAADLPAVEADVAQVRQVLANLVINASEAFETPGGTITITTGVIYVDLDYLLDACIGDVAAGEYVYLEVADDGEGMSPETQSRIFDPFFTTKFTGRGLGLAAVLGIVRGHRGALKLDSEIEGGSTFRLLLPAKARQDQETPPPAVLEERPWKGKGTVLVVDDEEAVRSALGLMLARLGFEVEEAPGGREGLELFQTILDRIDLVLLDLTMPGMGGAEVYEQMRALRPELRIMLMSGYDREEAVSSFPSSGLAGFLRKPFVLKDLEASLRRAFAE